MSAFQITISSDGKKTRIKDQLLEVDVQYEINRIPYALLVFEDGDLGGDGFKLSNSEYFIPGKELEVEIEYVDKPETNTTLFKGIVVKQAVEADINASKLIVELRDVAFKMTTVRQNKVFRKQTHQDIFNDIVTNYGFEADIQGETSIVYEELVQYYCSDWDFILSRADLYSWWVWPKQGKFSITDPTQIDTKELPKHSFELGTDIIFNLHFEISATHQMGQMDGQAWDIVNNMNLEGSANDTPIQLPGDLKPTELAEAVGAEKARAQSIVAMQQDEMDQWTQGKINRSRLAMYRGNLTTDGNPYIELTDTIEITGISTRFNGNAIATGVRHRISEEGWFTDIQFGLNPDSYVTQHKIEAEEAGGLLPGINGVQLGIVAARQKDPEDLQRIEVIIPALDNTTIWARVASPYAGDNRGILFYPEEGDEVIVGFLNDDPRQAIVLGSLYNKDTLLPLDDGEDNEQNHQKGIFSREGIQIKLDEEKKILEVSTSQDQYIKLDEDTEIIEIQDKHGNQIIMDQAGIHFVSTDAINMEAKGKITIKGSEVDVQ